MAKAPTAATRGDRAATWSGLGGLATSVAAMGTWFCCLPIAAGAAGGLAAVAGVAWDARPWLLGAAAVFLAFGFWRAYRREPCPEGSACARPSNRRRGRIVLWLSTAIAVLAFTFPYWSSWLYLQLL